MNILDSYKEIGCQSVNEIISLASTHGASALADVKSALAEAKGNISRLLGLSKQTADIFQKLFGTFSFTAAKACVLMARGNKEYLNDPNPQFVENEIFNLLVDIDVAAPFTEESAQENVQFLANEFIKLLASNDVAKKINSMNSANEMLQLFQNRILSKKNQEKFNVVLNLPENWKWVDLGRYNSSIEAVEMGHCGYDNRGNLISLRDQKNRPHVTLSFNPKDRMIYQIKGKGNSTPANKYWPAIVQLIKFLNASLYRGDDDYEDINPNLRNFINREISNKKSESRLYEAGRQNSTAMVVVPGSPPGKNVCALVRSLAKDRSRLIVVAQANSLSPGSFERMLRASIPDFEKKVRVVESGGKLIDMIASAEQNKHYSQKQSLEIFCDSNLAQEYSHDSTRGDLPFDPGLIAIRPIKIPTDDSGAIVRAVRGQDQAAQHRVLDPHIFSSPGGMAEYGSALLNQQTVHGESTIKEFLSDIAPSRELAISHLRDLLAKEVGDIDGLQYLGSGRNGSAYRHPDGFVLKVTTDPVEAQSASRIAGTSPEHLGRIYSIESISEGIWLIHQEDLRRLPKEIAEEFDMAVEIMELVGAIDHLNAGRALEAILTLSEAPAPMAGFAIETLRRFGVVEMCREMRLLGLSGDFHSGNILLRGSVPVLTDLGTPGEDDFSGEIQEYGTGAPGSGASSPATMRGSNSSSWSNGRGALQSPANYIPDDENADEKDYALDWGPGRVSGASF